MYRPVLLVSLALFAVMLAPSAGGQSHHSADTTPDRIISVSELLRVIQFFNTAGVHCVETGQVTVPETVWGVSG